MYVASVHQSGLKLTAHIDQEHCEEFGAVLILVHSAVQQTVCKSNFKLFYL